eukprot:GFYU01026706.1.p1 GENE.GFYU01026706.1~~GFYU01026706.1.p1  ORF type:complete len:521 (+),score=116.54 GFYU01026706.1:59-1621(+)
MYAESSTVDVKAAPLLGDPNSRTTRVIGGVRINKSPARSPLLVGRDVKDRNWDSDEENADWFIPSPIPGLPLQLYNVIFMSLAFMVLFTAYNTLQNYATSLLGTLGNTSLTVLYVTVCVTVFFAPYIVDSWGERTSMFLGALCFVAYMLTLIKISEWVVLVFSAVIGFGASILWVAQGAFLTLCSNHTLAADRMKGSSSSSLTTASVRGTYSGVFWGIFQVCNVAGNLSAYFVFSHMSSSALFVMFCVFGTIGMLMFLLLKPFPTTLPDDTPAAATKQSAMEESEAGDAPGPERLRPWESFLVAIRQFSQPYLMLYAPMFFWTGFELSFVSGEFPQLLPEGNIGIVLTMTGIGEIVGGIVIGRMSDVIGRSWSIVIGSVIYALSLVLACFLKYDVATSSSIYDIPTIAFIAAFGFGIGDSVFNTQVFAILGDRYADEISNAWSMFQFVQNLGSAIGFYYAISVPFHGDGGDMTQIIVQGVVLVVSCACYVASDRYGALQLRKIDEVIVSPSSSAALFHSK